jgi:hypothetical protein
VTLTAQGVRLVRANRSDAWTAEMVLMTSRAGMRLSQSWSSWDNAPFTDHSFADITVWEKITDAPW